MQVPKYNHKFLVMYHIDIFQNKLNVHHNFVNIPQYITHIQNISEVIKKKRLNNSFKAKLEDYKHLPE